MNENGQLGKDGEAWAAQYLKNNGFRIVDCNFRTRLGEIDIVAKKGKDYFFVEVKTRQTLTHGHPLESLPFYRIQRLKKMVQFYALKNHLTEIPLHLSLLGIDFSSQKPEFFFIPDIVD